MMPASPKIMERRTPTWNSRPTEFPMAPQPPPKSNIHDSAHDVLENSVSPTMNAGNASVTTTNRNIMAARFLGVSRSMHELYPLAQRNVARGYGVTPVGGFWIFVRCESA